MLCVSMAVPREDVDYGLSQFLHQVEFMADFHARSPLAHVHVHVVQALVRAQQKLALSNYSMEFVG